jgi:hypothetical protein
LKITNDGLVFIGKLSEDPVEVGHSAPLDLHWPSQLVSFVGAKGVEAFELWLPGPNPRFIQGVNIFVFAPLSEFLQHQFDFGDVELTCSAKSQDVVRVEPKQLHIEDVFVADPGFYFLHCLFLLR